jgi:hypothetical protein
MALMSDKIILILEQTNKLKLLTKTYYVSNYDNYCSATNNICNLLEDFIVRSVNKFVTHDNDKIIFNFISEIIKKNIYDLVYDISIFDKNIIALCDNLTPEIKKIISEKCNIFMIDYDVFNESNIEHVYYYWMFAITLLWNDVVYNGNKQIHKDTDSIKTLLSNVITYNTNVFYFLDSATFDEFKYEFKNILSTKNIQDYLTKIKNLVGMYYPYFYIQSTNDGGKFANDVEHIYDKLIENMNELNDTFLILSREFDLNLKLLDEHADKNLELNKKISELEEKMKLKNTRIKL